LGIGLANMSTFQRMKLYTGAAVIVAFLVVVSFLDANYGAVDPIKYPLMAFSGAVSVVGLAFVAFLDPNGAARHVSKSLFWGASVGLALVVLFHLPIDLPGRMGEWRAGNAKTAIDYAVGMVVTGTTFATAFALWRFGEE
jgi:hypothetical protein